MGYIKKLKNNELVGGTDKTTIYPVTSTEAVFEEISDNEFKSQKYLNNHITNERIVDNTIENDKLKDDTIDMGKLNTQLKTTIQNAYDASWKVKEEPFSLETKYDANDVVYDPDTNSSYVSLTADNQGNPVNPEDEGYVEGKWRIVINGISAVESTEVINETVGILEDKFDTLESNVDDAIEGLDNRIDEIQDDLSSLTAYETAATPSYDAQIPLKNLASTAQVGYYFCTVLGSENVKQVSNAIVSNTAVSQIGAFSLPPSGGHFKVKMSNAHTATSGNVTLRFGSVTATNKPLYYNGEPVSASNTWDNNEIISVYYDGQYYQASNSQGGSNKKIDAYLYGDLRTLEVGKNYQVDETVKTIDKQLRRVSKEIKKLSLSEEIIAGDIRTDSGLTYRADSTIATYNPNPSTPYEDGAYAYGSVTTYTYTLSAEEIVPGTITVNDAEIIITEEDDLSTIATKIAAAIVVKGWTSSAAENVVTVRCNTIGNNTTTITIDPDTENTGITVEDSTVAGTTVNKKYTEGEWVDATVEGLVTDGILIESDETWLATNATIQLTIAQWEKLGINLFDITKESVNSTGTAHITVSKLENGFYYLGKSTTARYGYASLHLTKGFHYKCKFKCEYKCTRNSSSNLNFYLDKTVPSGSTKGTTAIDWSLKQSQNKVYTAELSFEIDSEQNVYYFVIGNSGLGTNGYFKLTDIEVYCDGQAPRLIEYFDLATNKTVEETNDRIDSHEVIEDVTNYIGILKIAGYGGTAGFMTLESDETDAHNGLVTILTTAATSTSNKKRFGWYIGSLPMYDVIVEMDIEYKGTTTIQGYYSLEGNGMTTQSPGPAIENAVIKTGTNHLKFIIKNDIYKRRDNNNRHLMFQMTDTSAGNTFTITNFKAYLKMTDVEYNKCFNAEETAKNLLSASYYQSGAGMVKTSAVTLLHFTDNHSDGPAAFAIRHFYDLYSDYITDILNTGDTVTVKYSDDYDYYVNAHLTDALFCMGNHDGAAVSQSPTDLDGGRQQPYNRYFKPYIEQWGVVQPEDADTDYSLYWYKDYNVSPASGSYGATKTRLICLDSVWSNTQRGEGDAEYRDKQLTWFQAVLEDARINNFSVIVCAHYIPAPLLSEGVVKNQVGQDVNIHRYGWSLPEPNSRYATMAIYPAAIQSFIDAGGKFLAWIHGHYHTESFGYVDGYRDAVTDELDILAIGGGQSGTGRSSRNQGYREVTDLLYEHVCANIYQFAGNYLKIIRLGWNKDDYLRSIKTCVYDLVNRVVVSET